MAERLVILSDIWGMKKGLWITSYLGYLQQYYDIVFYDCQHLAGISCVIETKEDIYREFNQGGIDTAVAHLLVKEHQPSHYLAFCAGGSIAWKASLKGLPMKSLYAVSPMCLHEEDQKPDARVKLLYGSKDDNRPSESWSDQMDVPLEIVPDFGCDFYSDEKIIKKVCLELLERVMAKQV